MTNNCGNGFLGQFASISRVAIWAVLPGALTTLTSEVGTDLVGRSLGKISVALISCLVRKNMPMSMTGRCLAGLVAPFQQGFFWLWVAAAFVLSSGVDGSRFALRR
jgi:hypothetical protein